MANLCRAGDGWYAFIMVDMNHSPDRDDTVARRSDRCFVMLELQFLFGEPLNFSGGGVGLHVDDEA